MARLHFVRWALVGWMLVSWVGVGDAFLLQGGVCGHLPRSFRARSVKDGPTMTGSSSGGHIQRRQLLSGLASLALANLLPASPANAFGTGEREIGEIPASGLIFKDTIKVTAFKDPKVEGVELYVSDFQRPITERLQKDFFGDPSYASIGCARSAGIVKVSKDIYKGKDGEEVFEQARSLLFKSLRVRRLYDAETKTLVYVSYSTRFNKDDDENKSRFKTATCAVHVDAED